MKSNKKKIIVSIISVILVLLVLLVADFGLYKYGLDREHHYSYIKKFICENINSSEYIKLTPENCMFCMSEDYGRYMCEKEVIERSQGLP
jgi:hypothetical protein